MKALKITLIVITILLMMQKLEGQDFNKWGYWLTDIDPEIVEQCEYDMIVIDYSRTGVDFFTTDEVAKMKRMPDGGRRTVISYFSIGEAEEYRYYWKDQWKSQAPSWLEKENPDWPGNYKVRYWDPTWQAILFGHEESYLDQIVNNGFDGIYLDIVDAFEYFESTRTTAEREMVELIKAITKYARQKNPNFIVITQNGERLLGHPDLLEVINGAAKEDLYYGLEGDDIPTTKEEADYCLNFLQKTKSQDKFVLLASYVGHDKGKNEVLAASEKLGFLPYFGKRDLDQLHRNGGVQGVPYKSKVKKTATTNLRRTPGDFYLNTLYKGRIKSSVGTFIYNEKSVYSEQDGSGNVVFSEDVNYTDRRFDYTFKYGLTNNLEAGIRIPINYTTLELDEKIGGDQMSTTSEVGLGNIALVANLSLPFKEETNIYSLFSAEVGFPTDTKEEPLKSSSFFAVNYLIEKIWGKWGLALGTGISNFNLSNSLDDTQFAFRAGGLAVLSEKIFSSVLYTKIGDRTLLESSAELLLTRNSSLEFYFATDLESELQIRSFGVTFSIFH